MSSQRRARFMGRGSEIVGVRMVRPVRRELAVTDRSWDGASVKGRLMYGRAGSVTHGPELRRRTSCWLGEGVKQLISNSARGTRLALKKESMGVPFIASPSDPCLCDLDREAAQGELAEPKGEMFSILFCRSSTIGSLVMGFKSPLATPCATSGST